jgi:hypothetical protein
MRGDFVVLGNFFDYVVGLRFDAGAGVIFHRNVQRAQDQRGAFHVNGVAQQRIDDFGQRGLDGFFVLDAGKRVQARLRRRAHAAMHALVVVAELLSAERGRAAADAGDLDMSAAFSVFP